MIRKIISGGQTGADQGGLEAAEALGLETGGKMPRGFRTEKGPNPALAKKFGLAELASDEYPPRTRYNVFDSDGTVLFGNVNEPGTRMTRQLCKKSDKPYLVIETFDDYSYRLFGTFLDMYEIEVLNVAGNRESKYPGLQAQVKDFLIRAVEDKING